jgi:hypothetical protein
VQLQELPCIIMHLRDLHETPTRKGRFVQPSNRVLAERYDSDSC